MTTWETGKTYVVGMLKIELEFHHTKITDCTNAGKRGKKCQRVEVYCPDRMCWPNFFDGAEVSLNSVKDWISALEWALACTGMGATFYRDEIKGIEVAPIDCPEFIFENELVWVVVSPVGYKWSDLTDRHNEPRTYSPDSDSSAAKRKFYDWCVSRREMFDASSRCWTFTEAAYACGCSPRSYCALD